MFLGLPDPDPIITCTDPDPTINKKKSKKKLDFYYLIFFYFFLLFVSAVNLPSKSNKKKNLKNLFIGGILPATDEKKHVVRIRGSVSLPKCHVSATLVTGIRRIHDKS
jgi:hypothetical protein